MSPHVKLVELRKLTDELVAVRDHARTSQLVILNARVAHAAVEYFAAVEAAHRRVINASAKAP